MYNIAILSMKAIILKDINKPLIIDQFEDPIALKGQLRVDILSAALNHRDLWIIKGQYAGIETPSVLGSDACVVYRDLRYVIYPALHWGDNKDYQSKKFEVLGMPSQGTLAQYICVDREKLYPAPPRWTNDQCAALPLAGLTAYRSLIVKCQPQKEETVLISGIGGGVALMAMQFAIATGCKVYVTSSSDAKIKKAIDFGTEGGVNYNEEDWDQKLKKMTGGIDVVIDSAGGNGFSKLVHICKSGARVAFYGGSRGSIHNLNPQIMFWKQISIFGSTMGSPQDFNNMLNFVLEHKIIPVVDKVFDFEDFQSAFDHLSSGQQMGKVVIKIH